MAISSIYLSIGLSTLSHVLAVALFVLLSLCSVMSLSLSQNSLF